MILAWYLLGQLVAWCCLPLTWGAFGGLSDRGYSVRHPLGLLVTGFLLWTGWTLGLLSNDRQGAFLALLGALVLSTVAGRLGTSKGRSRLVAWLASRWRLLVVQEALFLAVFLGWCWVRMHDPAIDHTEQPMDLMLLAATLVDAPFPLQDPWLSGFAVSYYYFGYWLQALLAKLTGTAPEFAYNVAQAWWLAMVCSGAFGVVFNLLAAPRSARSPTPDRQARKAVIGGLLGAYLVVGAANLDGTLRAFRHLAGSASEAVPWWWFRSSRVMADAAPGGGRTELITEFPAFSFVLGDNHPHVLFLPFLLLALMLSLGLFRAAGEMRTEFAPKGSRQDNIFGVWRRVARGLLVLPARVSSGPPWTTWLVIALVAGSPLVINTWDLPLVWALLGLPAWRIGRVAASGDLQTATRRRFRAVIGGVVGLTTAWAALAVTTVVLFHPYLVTAQSQARGWLPNLLHPTDPLQFLLVFGAFLPTVVAFLFPRGDEPRAVWKGIALYSGVTASCAALVLFVGGLWAHRSTRGGEWLELYLQGREPLGVSTVQWLARPFVLLVLALLLGLAVAKCPVTARSTDDSAPAKPLGSHLFVVLLLSLAFGALLLPEVVFVHDVFTARINTVFKFYYQAWTLLALASAYAILELRSGAGLRTWMTRASLVVLLSSLVYPITALRSKQAEWEGERTLDGLAHVASDERAAIEWIRRQTEGRDIVLQGVGSSYRAEHSRVSAATGRATLLGWQGHEMQWRGADYEEMAAGREAAVEAIYRSGDPAEVAELLSRFSIDYLFIGSVERGAYGWHDERESLLADLTVPWFSQGDVRILRVAERPDSSRPEASP